MPLRRLSAQPQGRAACRAVDGGITAPSGTRRAFLTGSGALAVAILLPGCALSQTRSSSRSAALNDRIEIRADGTVHVRIGRIEMGQGLNSAIAQLAAEELDVETRRIVIPPVDTAFAPDEGFTDSSASMRGTGMAVRQAAAEARAMLLAMAARHLGAPVASLSVIDGTAGAGTRSFTWAEGRARALGDGSSCG